MDWTVTIFLGAVAVSAVVLVRTWLQNRALRGVAGPQDGTSSAGGNVWDAPAKRDGEGGQADGGSEGGSGD